MEHIHINFSKGNLQINYSDFEENTSFDSFKKEGNYGSIFLQGSILNKTEIIEKRNIHLFNEFFESEILKNVNFISQLRGSFYGFYNDVVNRKIYIFNDQLGTKNIYYFQDNERLIITTKYKNYFGLGLKVNTESAKMLLSYGYMLDDYTIINGVRKLYPGSIMMIDYRNNSFPQIEINRYFSFSDRKIDISEEAAIEKVDFFFRNAVKRQFEKDIEYKKKHFVALSGGLDSRMTSWVANDLGYKSQVNFTFSQSDYLDETIPKKIAADLKHDWVFKFLDNGIFLYDVDEITNISGGNVLYYGLAHSNSFLRLLNFSKLGILHSGQLGDVILGSFIKKIEPKDLDYLGAAYSELGIEHYSFEKKFKSFEEKEIELIYQRAINGANSGLALINQYTETYSPFYDLDFIEFCLSLPIKMRMNHKIYKKWILKKYPKAANYIWESTKRRIDTIEPVFKISGRNIYIRDLKDSLLRRIGLKKVPIATKNNMNPLQYWYNNNIELKLFINNYYSDNICLLDNNKELQALVIPLFENGTAVEKNQVLSLLSLLKKL